MRRCRCCPSLRVEIEAAAVLAPFAPVFQHRIERSRRSEARPQRLDQYRDDLGADVDAHFIQQGDRADRETEVHQRLVQRLNRLAFQQAARRFVDVRRQDAVDVKPALSPTTMAVLPCLCANATVVAMVSSLVPACGITSTSGILSTGLK